jgi:hypothetical protein
MVGDGMVGDGAWTAALDALATRLRAQRAFLDGVGPSPAGTWEPPAGHLPDALRPRAVALAADSVELERRARARHARGAAAAPRSPYR